GEKVELRHRASAWNAGNPLLGDPYVDRIVFRILNDADAALVALKAGTIDVYGPRPQQFLNQMNDPKLVEHVEKHVDRSGGYVYFGWNEKRAMFQDKRVRQAFSYLVDKKNVCKKLQLGMADPVESPVYPARPEHDQSLLPWPFDPKKAKQLLAEAGWKDTDGDGVLDHDDGKGGRIPLRFEILSNSGNDDRKNLGLVVVDEMKRAGIDAGVRTIDWSILLERVKNFDFDAVILGWTS